VAKENIGLSREKETLLVPLYCRYLESKKETPIIRDEKAVEMVERIEYDFSRLAIPKQTYVTVCLRAKQFDNYVREYLAAAPGGTVIQLGCGLDSRCLRADNGKAAWYDLDFPEVIDLRKRFFKETARYHLIPSSVTNLSWLKTIKLKGQPALILAEGLFMYLKEEEIKALVKALLDRFPGGVLAFDSYSATAAKGIGAHPSIKKTGAVVHWGINDARAIESWDKRLRLSDEWFFTQSNELAKLDRGYRLLFRIMGLFAAAKKAHRILVVRWET
jgi:O-methyltransferase involved in polyketide biosynthesis